MMDRSIPEELKAVPLSAGGAFGQLSEVHEVTHFVIDDLAHFRSVWQERLRNAEDVFHNEALTAMAKRLLSFLDQASAPCDVFIVSTGSFSADGFYGRGSGQCLVLETEPFRGSKAGETGLKGMSR